MAELRTPDGTQPLMNYQFGTYKPPGTQAIAGADTNNVSVAGSTAPTMTIAAGGRLPGTLGLPQFEQPASQIPQQGETGGRVNPPAVAPVPPGGTGTGVPGAPTFQATDPNAMGGDWMGQGGDYGEQHDPYKMGKNWQIASPEAYDIGPYHGYAYDAGNRVLQSGYDAASQLAQVGNQTAQLGVQSGQQLGNVAQQYAGQLTQAGAGAQAAAQNYEDMIRRDRIDTKDAALGAQTIGLEGQQAAQTVGNRLTKQGGQFIGEGQDAATQNIADVNLALSERRAQAGAQYANQLAGIGAQEGPSAAQAQLQSALNQSQAANLAMARSGRGWGGSASAQSQALAANAAAGQQAANSSAMLRAQEEQQRLQLHSQNVAQASQLQQAAANTALSQQQLGAQTNLQEAQIQAQRQQALYGLGLQSQTQGAELGLQGSNLALAGNQQYLGGLGQSGQMAAQAAQTDLAGRQANMQALAQGGQLATQGLQAGAELGLQGIGQGAGAYAQGQQMAQGGELQAMQFASQQQQADQAMANNALQQYGIQRGVAIQQQSNTNQLIGSGIQAAASMGAAAMMLSDKRAKTDIEPAKVDLRPMSNYQLAGAAAGEAPIGVTNPGLTGGAGSAGAGIAQDEAQKKAGMGMIADGVSNFGASMAQPKGFNPVLAQSLQQVGAGQMVSDKRAKTDIQALDRAGNEAVSAIQNSGKTGQLAALDKATGDNIQAIRNAQGMSPTSAFDAAQAYSYQYKQPEKYGEGEYIGLMAQDLEKSPAGRTAVQTLPDGKKAVDMNRLGMLTAAAQSQTQEQVSTLEEKIARLQRRVLSQQSYSDGTY